MIKYAVWTSSIAKALTRTDCGIKDPKVAKRAGIRNAMGMMDTIVTFQNGAWHARHAGPLEPTHRSATPFRDFSRLEHALAAHKHTQ